MGALSLSSICHLLLLILLAILSSGYHSDAANKGFSILEATVDEIQLAFKQKKLTSRQLVQFYINRIQRLNPELHGVIEVNPDAGALADKADYERKVKAPVSFSKLHGIPVLVKDNIATEDKMNTTAGSLALLGSVVPRDAGVVAKLREAGAIILGKASLSEWSGSRGNNAPPGWSARGGQGVNPYNKMQTPCGSSSGSAISAAANFATVTLGTETDNSILCASSLNSVVGIKPTIGLTSRAGVVPITQRQDTVGPICSTVSDATYVLDVIAGVDKNDKATIEKSKYIPKGGYAQFLRPNGLKGKRLGIVRHPYFEFNISNKEIETLLINTFEQHLSTLRKEGAIVIDHLEITNIDEIMNDISSEDTAMNTEFKIDLNAYLKELVSSPVRSVADVIVFNKKNSKLEKTEEYGQEILIAAEATNGIDKAALATLARQTNNGLVKLMKKYKLDALVAGGGPSFPIPNISKILAIGGFPGITVPAGYIQEGTPFGIFFGVLKGFEPKLIEIAYGFEKATKIRKPPQL
ncbi:probable amidase At4g34880 [Humulus lupulus]|uniref:probable amidase At4g34880 n=1 Tax=Humulus lupulus TaxID=3486 RepID=UPI002B40F9B4|nr:probable amidase At4g34880 [Humulus lupulus]